MTHRSSRSMKRMMLSSRSVPTPCTPRSSRTFRSLEHPHSKRRIWFWDVFVNYQLWICTNPFSCYFPFELGLFEPFKRTFIFLLMSFLSFLKIKNLIFLYARTEKVLICKKSFPPGLDFVLVVIQGFRLSSGECNLGI